MKIVDINEFYAERGGGVRTYVNAKLAAAAALGHEVVVIAPGPADREEQRSGGRIVWVRSPALPVDPRYRMLVRQRAVFELLNGEAPDVVESSSPGMGALFSARWQGAAFKSLVFHQDAVAVYAHTLLGAHCGERVIDRMCAGYFAYLRAISRRHHLTVTGGEWLAERLRAQGVHAVTAVPFGVEKQTFSPGLRDESLRRLLLARAGLPPSARLLVALSRHHPEKRLFTSIEAVARSAARCPVGLVIYGDGPLRRLTEWKAARVGGIVVAGRLDDRPTLAGCLASADALLHGSSAETFGLGVAEALAAGVPVVVPDRGGAADLAGPEYAERFRAGSASSCAAAILRLFARDQDRLRAAATHAGQHRVRSADQHFAALFALYAERLHDRRVHAD
jgi:alpha-1,6-mannosyltransferase